MPRASSRFAGLSRGLIRKRGKRNRTEASYELALQAAPFVAWWKFEPFTVRLSHPDGGQPARYTADFLVVMGDGTTYVDDVKNPRMDDPAAIVRIKAAAELFPIWTWRLVRLVGGEWQHTEV